MTTLKDIPLRKIDGTKSSLKEFEGDVLLVVNVASKCGLTPQYEGLQDLYDTYRDKGFQVLGFPSNDFGAQEPGTHDEIQTFCSTNYKVTFPLFEKLSTKGDGQHSLYQSLVDAQPRATELPGTDFRGMLKGHGIVPDRETDVLWNFEKFLISRNGEVVGRFAPDVAPREPLLTTAIERELGISRSE